MGARRRRSDRAGRAAMCSPGRPSVGRREERQRFWAAIARGVSSEDAAGEAGVSAAVGVRWFREGGGMPTVTQAPLSGRYLSLAEREEIAILRARGCGVREIARSTGPFTVDDLARVAPQCRHAQRRVLSIARRPRSGTPIGARSVRRSRSSLPTSSCEATSRTVSPARSSGPTGPRSPARRYGGSAGVTAAARIAAGGRRGALSRSRHRLRVDFPDDESMRISHEAIYQALYVQGRGALRRELTACLRTGRALRVPRARSRARGKGFVTEEILISERPAEAEDRAVPGHWEGDLILGLDSSAIGTLVERSTRFVILLHLPPMDDRGTAHQERARARRPRRRGRPGRDRRGDHDPARAVTPLADLGSRL